MWKEEEEGLEKGIRKILASLDNFSTIFGYDYEDPDGGKAKTFYTTQIKPWKTEMDRRLNAAADMGEKNILFNEALAFEAGLKGEYFSPTKFSSLITGAENALIEGESYGRGGLIRWIIRAILEDSADSARQIVRKLEWLAVMQAMREEMQPISPAIRPGIMEIKQRFFTNPSEKTASGPTVQGKLTQALEVLDKEDLSHFCNFSTRMSKDGRWLDPNGYRIKDESKEKYQKITQYLNVMCGKNGEMSDILNSARNILEKLNRGTVLEILKPFMPKREVEV